MEAQRAPSIVRSPRFSFYLERLHTTLALTGDTRTMARTFSDALDNAFMLDSEVDNLSQSVQQKYGPSHPLSHFVAFIPRAHCICPSGLMADLIFP